MKIRLLSIIIVFLVALLFGGVALFGDRVSVFQVEKSQDLLQHNTPNDCWIRVENKNYNVTSYAQKHPGGVDTIYPYCGKDATEAFITKGGKGSHSLKALELLKNFEVR